MKKSNPEAAQQSHKLPVGGKLTDPGSKGGSGGGVIDTGNPSVPAMDPSGFAVGSHAELSRNQKNQPVMKPVDATSPVPPGYAQVQPSGGQPDEGV